MRIPISKIKINVNNKEEKRCRSIFGDVHRLAESIKTCGLLHPIVVDKIEPPQGDFEYLLIAGERRIRAHCLNGMSEIEATLKSDTTAFERKTMELEENIARKDISWQEEVECTRQLHELKQQEYGEKTCDKNSTDGWGVRETAEMLGKSLGKVSQDIKTAEILRDRPDIANKVKTLKHTAANTVVRRLLEAENLRSIVDAEGVDIHVELLHGDCIDLIDGIKDRSINCLLTDPPFGNPGIVNVGVSDKATYNFTKSNVSDFETLYPLFEKLIPKWAKKLTIGAHVYIFTGLGEPYYKMLQLLRQNGFIIDDLPLIWYKMRPSTMPRDYSYVSSYEAIIFGHYGEKNRRLMKPVKNVLDIPAIAPQKRIHPLQRPDDLLRLLIENSTNAGETVLDCFAGSGSTLKVARDLQRKAIGFEKDDDNYIRALNWLQTTCSINEQVK
jgi:ParB/RepB/Spo0J family partition protein